MLAMTPSPQAGTLAQVMDDLAGEKVAVLVGAEGPGLTETAMRAADVRVRIPMSRGTDSLNVATAAALAFYERARH
jgi:tRNA G18 (ribose-2'-O)-methylase SpoU